MRLLCPDNAPLSERGANVYVAAALLAGALLLLLFAAPALGYAAATALFAAAGAAGAALLGIHASAPWIDANAHHAFPRRALVRTRNALAAACGAAAVVGLAYGSAALVGAVLGAVAASAVWVRMFVPATFSPTQA